MKDDSDSETSDSDSDWDLPKSKKRKKVGLFYFSVLQIYIQWGERNILTKQNLYFPVFSGTHIIMVVT